MESNREIAQPFALDVVEQFSEAVLTDLDVLRSRIRQVEPKG